MEFIEIASQFFNTYMNILLPFFMLGIANMLAPTFSYGFALFSIFSFALYVLLNSLFYAYLAVAGIAIAFALKWLGY